MPITKPAARADSEATSRPMDFAHAAQERRDGQRGEEPVDHCRNARENLQQGFGDSPDALGGIVRKIDRRHQADGSRHDHGDEGNQQRSDEQRHGAEDVLVHGARLGTRAGESALRRPVQAKQELEERNFGEKQQGFHDQRHDDADGGQDRDDRAGYQHEPHDAFDDVTGAESGGDGPVPVKEPGRGKCRTEYGDQQDARGMDAAVGGRGSFLGRVREADETAECDRLGVADERLDLRNAYSSKISCKARLDDRGLDARIGNAPDDQGKQRRTGRAEREIAAMLGRQRMQLGDLAANDRDRARAADDESRGSQHQQRNKW